MDFPLKVSTHIPIVLTHSTLYAHPMIHWAQFRDKRFEIHTVGASFLSLKRYSEHFGTPPSNPYDSEVLFTPIMDRFSFENLPSLRFMSESSCYWMASLVRDDTNLVCIIHCFAVTGELIEFAGGRDEATQLIDSGTVNLLQQIGPRPILAVNHPASLNKLCETTRPLSTSVRGLFP
jgi:hypothetical protein